MVKQSLSNLTIAFVFFIFIYNNTVCAKSLLSGITVSQGNGGVRIENVARNNDVRKAGLRDGDIIVSINDIDTKSLSQYVAASREGILDTRSLDLKVKRRGEIFSIRVTCEDCPEAKTEESTVKEAELVIEKLLFENCRKEDTVSGYEKFIKKYPNSKYVEDARLRVDQLNYEPCRNKGTIKSYKKFVDEFPENRYVSEAKQKIEELNFNAAENENTIDSYENFIEQYPGSSLVQNAREKLEIKYFEEAKQKGTVEAYEAFIKLYPNSSNVKEAKLMLEKLPFEYYKKKDTVSGYQEFIKNYPNSRYVNDAKIRIDQLIYAKYERKSTINALKEFVAKYPENRYVNEAEQKIAQLILVGEPVLKSFFSIKYLIFGIFGIGLLASVLIKRKEIARQFKTWQYGKKLIALLNNKVKAIFHSIKEHFKKVRDEQKKRKELLFEESLNKVSTKNKSEFKARPVENETEKTTREKTETVESSNIKDDTLESKRKLTMIIYAIQAGFLLFGISLLVAVIINYIKRSDVSATLFESHFKWQIRTFWHHFILLVIAIIMFWIPIIAVLLLIVDTILLIYRIAKGWLRLNDRKPMYL